MKGIRSLTRKISLRHLIFLLLLVSGLIPLAIGSYLLTRQNIDILRTQEQDYLTRSSRVLSRDLNEHVGTFKDKLGQLGYGLLTLGGEEAIQEIRDAGSLGPESETGASLSRIQRYVARFLLDHREEIHGLRLLDPQGIGLTVGAGDAGDAVVSSMAEAFEAAMSRTDPEAGAVYDFVRSAQNRPLAVVAVPIFQSGASRPSLVVVGTIELGILEQVFRMEAQGQVSVFLISDEGRILWAEGRHADERASRALAQSTLVQDFVRRPLHLTQEYRLFLQGEQQRMLGRVSPVREAGWGVVVQKPVAAAYEAARRLVSSAVVSSLVLVALALVFGAVAAKRFSDPIQKLAETSHEIAAGNFGQRVEVVGPGREVSELAEDFNRMSGHVESYIDKIRQAAKENQELFIGSIRALAGAVDAKDPYTRGHSERVARYSRTIARYLGQDEEFLYRIWISGVLHDVGKIGIEDRILKKGGVLTNEEYEEMKLHPVIGYDILKSLDALEEMLPAIRWHHEAWNGRGYPDGLKGEAIPLIARIVSVGDTFDAITTNRPYQKAYTPEYAVETITKLTGARFDAKVVTAFLRAFQDGAIEVEEQPPAEEVMGLGA
ncbi:MAG: HD domain-containing protein [Thermoanaerobaculia bacterium]|nr:HD domain-containing protein [Thermoanaerobaculia bacterium]